MISTILQNNLQPAREFIFGFADLQGLLDSRFNGFSYGISIGRKLNDEIIDKLDEGPTIEYYHHYNQVNSELAALAKRIQSELLEIGVDSLMIEPTISLSKKGNEKYLETLTFELSHKMVATRAGLGWIGKTDLFISRSFGPRLRLVSILLRMNPGIKSVPIEKSRCGKCTLCVERCPAKAANGKSWNIAVHRDEFFDAHKCRDKCGELAWKRLQVDERICGLCVYICPVGKGSI